MARDQYWTIIILSALALFFAALWLFAEICKAEILGFCLVDEICNAKVLKFNLEPLVVSLASAVPIVTLFWPFRPKYRSKRIRDTITVEGAHRKVAEMGDKEHKFIVPISAASDTCAHIYLTDPVMDGACIADESRFEDVKNSGAYTLSSENQTPNRGDIIILKNRYGNYCLMMFEKIEAKGRDGATRDVWTIRYTINPTGGVNFS